MSHAPVAHTIPAPPAGSWALPGFARSHLDATRSVGILRLLLGVFHEAADEHGRDERTGQIDEVQEVRCRRVRITLLGHDVTRQAREHVEH